MRIIDKYLCKEYLKLYFLFNLFFIAIFLLTDIFQSINTFVKQANSFLIVKYYLLQIPYLFALLSPLASIVSILFIISYMTETYQIQAIQVSGTSIKRTVFPLLIIGIIISFSLLFLNETLTFKANQISQKIKEESFLKITPKKVQRNIFIQVPPYYLLYIRLLYPEKEKMEDIIIYKISSPSSLIICKEGDWTGKEWIFFNGTEYILKEELKETFFDKKIIPLNKKPAYFVKKYFPFEKMNITELKKYIYEYRESGFDTLDMETEFYSKISYPFANFILLFLGIPLALFLRKGGKGASFALGLIVSFGYYEITALSKSMGEGGMVTPFLAAWIPNILFLIGGIYLFTKTE